MTRPGTTSAEVVDVQAVGYLDGSGVLTAASTTNPLPASATFSGTQDVNVVSGSVTASGTLGLAATDFPTATTAAVADAATSTTLLAASATRVGFSIRNLSTAILYIKFGSTATAADSHIEALAQNARFGDAGPGVYTGIITGIWASDAGGSAIVTSW
jgi:hypothetical protein